jgi:hypothetical protein
LIETGFGLWVVALQLSASGFLYSGGKATIMSLLYRECRMIRQAKWAKAVIWQFDGVAVEVINGGGAGVAPGRGVGGGSLTSEYFLALGGGLF